MRSMYPKFRHENSSASNRLSQITTYNDSEESVGFMADEEEIQNYVTAYIVAWKCTNE